MWNIRKCLNKSWDRLSFFQKNLPWRFRYLWNLCRIYNIFQIALKYQHRWTMSRISGRKYGQKFELFVTDGNSSEFLNFLHSRCSLKRPGCLIKKNTKNPPWMQAFLSFFQENVLNASLTSLKCLHPSRVAGLANKNTERLPQPQGQRTARAQCISPPCNFWETLQLSTCVYIHGVFDIPITMVCYFFAWQPHT